MRLLTGCCIAQVVSSGVQVATVKMADNIANMLDFQDSAWPAEDHLQVHHAVQGEALDVHLQFVSLRQTEANPTNRDISAINDVNWRDISSNQRRQLPPDESNQTQCRS